MAATRTRHHLEVQGDHVRRLARNAADGLIELIWNALDTEANEIDVDIERNELDGVTSVVVRDDGLGMTAERGREALVRLGGYWKQLALTTPNENRPIHGKLGEGRFKAFALGGSIRLESVTETGEGRVLSTAYLSMERPDEVEVVGPEETRRARGTVVTVGDITGSLAQLTSESQLERYRATFAVYLTSYPDVSIRIDGQPLDPGSIVLARGEYVVDAPDGGPAIDLTVIEWPRDLSPHVFMCDAEGTPLARVEAQVRSPSVFVTGYARWWAFREHEDVLALADAHPLLKPAL